MHLQTQINYILLHAWCMAIGLCLFSLCGRTQAICFEIKNISQGSNYFIYRSSDDLLFISSLDGLNIFDGVHTKVYSPSTHNMFGNNMQSSFFEDSLGRVWFTTYQALNYYDPTTDDLEYFILESSQGDSIFDNYKILHVNANFIYLKAGREVFVFDTYQQKMRKRIFLNLEKVSFAESMVIGKDTLVIAATLDVLHVYQLNSDAGFTHIHQFPVETRALYPGKNIVWVVNKAGELNMLHLDSFYLQQVYASPNGKMGKLTRMDDTTIILTNYTDSLYFFNEKTHGVVHTLGMMSAEGRNIPIDGISNVYVDRDTMIWIAQVGVGIYGYNPRDTKFKHYLEGYDITQLLPYTSDQCIALTRRSGILLFNKNGNILRQWNEMEKLNNQVSAVNGIFLDRETLLFTSRDDFFKISIRQNKIYPVPVFGHDTIQPHLIRRLSNGRIIVSNQSGILYELTINKGVGQYLPYVNLRSWTNLTLDVAEDRDGNLYVSNDDKNILVLKPDPVTKSHVYSHTLPLVGGLMDIYDPGRDTLYIAHRFGLYVLDKQTQHFQLVRDKQHVLAQTIYSIQGDQKGMLWLGTNRGLVSYDPENETAFLYSRVDGIQWREYNTRVSATEQDGSLWFGGINGVNYFHPEAVEISQRPVDIRVTSVLINNQRDDSFRQKDWNQTYILPYARNSIDFQVHAVDLSNPAGARIKYKLDGIDREYTERGQADADLKFPALPAGLYVLNILGQNADGVWNTTPYQISILINKPYWQTWWFIMMLVMFGISIIYLVVREYYQRKLRRQKIVIDRQMAIEAERTRIAAEMHDDLGSGLTTIRYLSDKALKQASNPEEINQIQRIADQSNALVRNMSEIIWAMNSRFDTADSLIAYLRRYAVEYLQQHQIPVEFKVEDEANQVVPFTGEKRRNVFLVVKEMLHNTVKYSGARQVQISVSVNGAFELAIHEIDGKGFDFNADPGKGNGLYNCKRRMAAIGGHISFEKSAESMDITLTVPLTS